MELGGTGWSWVEVDGTGWRMVHGLVVPNALDNHSCTPRNKWIVKLCNYQESVIRQQIMNIPFEKYNG